MSEITKALVLEVFMRIYERLGGERSQQRALHASNLTMDELAPWSQGMSQEMRGRLDLVTDFLEEILKDDFGIEIRNGVKLTKKEGEAGIEGGKAAKEFWDLHADRVPTRAEPGEELVRWFKLVQGFAFDLVPADRTADKEWTRGFIEGFTGDIWRFIQGLPGIDWTPRKDKSGDFL